ncbi:MAG: nicotinamide-nucleotide amidohydrolase family protein [Spirochaetales bacterium]|nr:nicotinamide-nucleotide amidohydrolase family protein [Spirochaetales bacterium]
MLFNEIRAHFGRNAVYSGHVTAPQVFTTVLRECKTVCATAESCTGGQIAQELTSSAGSSAVFWGGVVVYANEAKSTLLNIPSDIIQQKGAVSGDVVELMAKRMLDISGAGVSMAVSGIAGPDGGTAEKPVGTVWIAVGLANGPVYSGRYQFSGTRNEVRKKAAHVAMLSAANLVSIQKTGEASGSLLGAEYKLDSFYDW